MNHNCTHLFFLLSICIQAPETSFTGAIPATFGNLVDLQELDLSSNALDGALPDELGQLTKLERVALYDNGKCTFSYGLV